MKYWRGAAVGACLGAAFGGWLGALTGAYFGYRVEERMAYGKRARSRRAAGPQSFASELEKSYRTLGASPRDTDEELKRKYRNLAKLHHPDAAASRGSQGKSAQRESEIMSRINEAWSIVREHRSI